MIPFRVDQIKYFSIGYRYLGRIQFRFRYLNGEGNFFLTQWMTRSRIWTVLCLRRCDKRPHELPRARVLPPCGKLFNGRFHPDLEGLRVRLPHFLFSSNSAERTGMAAAAVDLYILSLLVQAWRRSYGRGRYPRCAAGPLRSASSVWWRTATSNARCPLWTQSFTFYTFVMSYMFYINWTCYTYYIKRVPVARSILFPLRSISQPNKPRCGEGVDEGNSYNALRITANTPKHLQAYVLVTV